MSIEFALDLRIARKRSGLTQQDCAHLLAVHPSKVSLLENGKVLPSVRETYVLSFIYGESFESLMNSIFHEVGCQLIERLQTMPNAPKHWRAAPGRANTLSVLARRLEVHAKEYGD